MSARQGGHAAIQRNNRRLAWALGAVAVLFYIAIAIRWTQGF